MQAVVEKTLDDYMNDPDIINEPMPLREIHAIRFMLQDKTKDMTSEEVAEYFQKRTEELGIKTVSTEELQMQLERFEIENIVETLAIAQRNLNTILQRKHHAWAIAV